MKREKTTSLQSVWWSVSNESHLLHSQNRILLQIRVLNLKASCKAQEGWKNNIEELSFASFHHDLQPKPKKAKQTSFGLSLKKSNPAVLVHSITEELHQGSKKKGSEVRGSLLDAFLLYPDQQTSFHYWQSKSWLLVFSKCSQEHWLRKSTFSTPFTSASQLPHKYHIVKDLCLHQQACG